MGAFILLTDFRMNEFMLHGGKVFFPLRTAACPKGCSRLLLLFRMNATVERTTTPVGISPADALLKSSFLLGLGLPVFPLFVSLVLLLMF